jgi:hypothetical protein
MRTRKGQNNARVESASKEMKFVLSAGRVMATSIWDALPIIFINLIKKDKTTILGEK